MSFVQDDLWGHILWSATERPRLLAKTDLLSKAKIHLERIYTRRMLLSFTPLRNREANLDLLSFRPFSHQFGITSVVQYQVLRFEVSVYDSFGMQVSERLHHTRRVKPRC